MGIRSPAVLRLAAFTDRPDGGNPAGVVLDAGGLDDGRMQAIATEVGYSETAFLVPLPETGTFRVRYFSPAAEVAFCGHATIAAGVALARRDGPGDLVFHTPAGAVPVSTSVAGAAVIATLTSVTPSVEPVGDADLAEALALLRWSPADLDPALPPRYADAGVRHLVLAAATRERLADLDYDFDATRAFMLRNGLTTFDLVWREGPTTFQSRNPFAVGGVVEDPATGAAAAAFGGYLRELGVVAPPVRVVIHQGVDLGRPSLLLVDIDPAPAGIRVSGGAVPIEDAGA